MDEEDQGEDGEDKPEVGIWDIYRGEEEERGGLCGDQGGRDKEGQVGQEDPRGAEVGAGLCELGEGRAVELWERRRKCGRRHSRGEVGGGSKRRGRGRRRKPGGGGGEHEGEGTQAVLHQ